MKAMNPLFNRVVAEHRTLVMTLATILLVNIAAYALVVRPLGAKQAGAADRAATATAALAAIFDWNQQRELSTLAPATIEAPTGSKIALQYFEDGSPPVLAVRLQEVFGWLDTPTVNDGRTRVTLHLLSPGRRPVQVTQDLRSFWTRTYPQVRKELRSRYPRHSWPEDPLTATPIRGPKRRST